MSRRYVELFDQFKSCAALAAVGFGFNTDDSHINGLFRKLVDEDSKPLFWVRPANGQSVDQCKSELLEKLRLPEIRRHLMHPILIDRDTREANGDLWLKVISDLYPVT
jgi:hypothetical protein